MRRWCYQNAPFRRMYNELSAFCIGTSCIHLLARLLLDRRGGLTVNICLKYMCVDTVVLSLVFMFTSAHGVCFQHEVSCKRVFEQPRCSHSSICRLARWSTKARCFEQLASESGSCLANRLFHCLVVSLRLLLCLSASHVTHSFVLGSMGLLLRS